MLETQAGLYFTGELVGEPDPAHVQVESQLLVLVKPHHVAPPQRVWLLLESGVERFSCCCGARASCLREQKGLEGRSGVWRRFGVEWLRDGEDEQMPEIATMI